MQVSGVALREMVSHGIDRHDRHDRQAQATTLAQTPALSRRLATSRMANVLVYRRLSQGTYF